MERTHDLRLYLNDDRFEKPKEIFKVLVGLARETGLLTDGATVCDFGCATGEFLYYLRGQAPEPTYVGYDVVPELIDRARERVSGVTFGVGDVNDPALVEPESMTMSFLLGVHSIFDEFEPCFRNVIRWTRKGGRVLVFGLFNPDPVDVWVRCRLAADPVREHREPGWNVFSRASVSRFLDGEIGPGRHRYIPFDMPLDLARNPADPLRTWTTMMDGRRTFVNGLSLVCNLEILEIRP